jgi:hypothetical protein
VTTSRSVGIAVMTAVAIGAPLFAPQAGAAIVTLEPIPGNQITSGSQVENYFNGGQDSFQNPGNGDPPGPADHVIFPTVGTGQFNTTFFDNLTAGKVGSPTQTGVTPSGAHDVFFQSVASTMNLAAGYAAESLSFEYSFAGSAFPPSGSSLPTVTLWSNANGTGVSDVLQLAYNGTGCSTSWHCNWTFDTANLNALPGGVAESVTFGGSNIGSVDFDSITMNVVPVPSPGALSLLLSAVAGLVAVTRLRKVAMA